MELSLKKTYIPIEIKEGSRIANRRKCRSDIQLTENEVLVTVFASGRKVGFFTFERDDGRCTLKTKSVIERDFYPFEFAITELIKPLKRRKSLSICWE